MKKALSFFIILTSFLAFHTKPSFGKAQECGTQESILNAYEIQDLNQIRKLVDQIKSQDGTHWQEFKNKSEWVKYLKSLKGNLGENEKFLDFYDRILSLKDESQLPQLAQEWAQILSSNSSLPKTSCELPTPQPKSPSEPSQKQSQARSTSEPPPKNTERPTPPSFGKDSAEKPQAQQSKPASDEEEWKNLNTQDEWKNYLRKFYLKRKGGLLDSSYQQNLGRLEALGVETFKQRWPGFMPSDPSSRSSSYTPPPRRPTASSAHTPGSGRSSTSSGGYQRSYSTGSSGYREAGGSKYEPNDRSQAPSKDNSTLEFLNILNVKTSNPSTDEISKAIKKTRAQLHPDLHYGKEKEYTEKFKNFDNLVIHFCKSHRRLCSEFCKTNSNLCESDKSVR